MQPEVNTVYQGDCFAVMQGWPDGFVDCAVTSPPYFGLRDYGVDGQIGLEESPDAYIAKLVDVFREVRRVLKPEGTLWLNLGDSYASSPAGNTTVGVSGASTLHGVNGASGKYRDTLAAGHAQKRDTSKIPGTKPKDLLMIPAQVALALRADGWYLRSDIIWHKRNPMPESVTDRPTSAHEHVFLLSKSSRYYFDSAAIAEPVSDDMARRAAAGHTRGQGKVDATRNDRETIRPTIIEGGNRNSRNVWTISTIGYPGAHFATFPPELPRRCILAGCALGGIVLDPFAGSGTCGEVAAQLGRNYLLIELNPEYVKLAKKRTAQQGLPLGDAA